MTVLDALHEQYRRWGVGTASDGVIYGPGFCEGFPPEVRYS